MREDCLISKNDPFFLPDLAMELARFAGVSSFRRLPVVPPDHPRFANVDIGILGIRWNGCTANHRGARPGLQQLRRFGRCNSQSNKHPR